MIYHLKHHEIDFEKWDKIASKQFVPYSCSWYLNSVSPNWEALVLNDYEAIMPLTCKKKWGIDYLAQPYFTQQLGIFGDNIFIQTIEQFIAEIINKYRYIDINLNEKNSSYLINNKNTFHQTNILLELNKPYEILHKDFSENTKRMIKKAKKFGVRIEETKNHENLINLFKYTKGKSLKHLDNKAYLTLNNLIINCKKYINVQIKNIYQENNLLGGAIFLKFNHRLIFFFSAIGDKGKELGAMHYLIADTVKENSHRNLILDFEGSNNVNLARFYKSFGSKEIVYLRFKKNNLPYPIKWLKK